jgi:hypothetical protein
VGSVEPVEVTIYRSEVLDARNTSKSNVYSVKTADRGAMALVGNLVLNAASLVIAVVALGTILTTITVVLFSMASVLGMI